MAISLVSGVAGAAMQATPLAMHADQMQTVSAWLRNPPAASGTMLVWGNEPRLYDERNAEEGSADTDLRPTCWCRDRGAHFSLPR